MIWYDMYIIFGMIQQQPVTLLFMTSCPSYGHFEWWSINFWSFLHVWMILCLEGDYWKGEHEQDCIKNILLRDSKGIIYIYRSQTFGAIFPMCGYRLPPFEAQRKRRRAKTRAGRKKKGEHASRCGLWHLLVEGDMVTCGYLWMIGGCMMTVWCIKIFGYLPSTKMKLYGGNPYVLCERIIEYWKSICTSHQDQVVSLLHCNHRTAETRRVEHHGCIKRSDWCRDLRFDHMAPWCDHMRPLRPQQSQRP